ncbi:EAL domain-containing protein [Lacisediminihabitans sp.]|uniref:EAL domain-containing protein n=1 Tax=Lacisediminihabitans sp. TaxID=2787631 RepID=UPI00374D2B00
MGLTSELRGAVARGEIVAHYQPQIDLASDRIVAVEALCRWRPANRPMLLPDDFIPLAEDNGLICEIGDFMMETSCRLADAWTRRGLDTEVAFNVSADQLATSSFFTRFTGMLDALSLDPALLTVEITESRSISDVPGVAARLERLRGRGVTISVDDFGTGHSSVERVAALPTTEVKIDGSLMRDDSASGAVMLNGVVALLRDRGLRVVAEGIETPRQLERARAAFVDRAQGFLIGRPVPAALMGSRLADQDRRPAENG